MLTEIYINKGTGLHLVWSIKYSKGPSHEVRHSKIGHGILGYCIKQSLNPSCKEFNDH